MLNTSAKVITAQIVKKFPASYWTRMSVAALRTLYYRTLSSARLIESSSSRPISKTASMYVYVNNMVGYSKLEYSVQLLLRTEVVFLSSQRSLTCPSTQNQVVDGHCFVERVHFRSLLFYIEVPDLWATRLGKVVISATRQLGVHGRESMAPACCVLLFGDANGGQSLTLSAWTMCQLASLKIVASQETAAWYVYPTQRTSTCVWGKTSMTIQPYVGHGHHQFLGLFRLESLRLFHPSSCVASFSSSIILTEQLSNSFSGICSHVLNISFDPGIIILISVIPIFSHIFIRVMIRHSASCDRSDLRKHIFYDLHSSPLHCYEEVNFHFWREVLVFCVVEMNSEDLLTNLNI